MFFSARPSRFAFGLAGAISLSLSASASCKHPKCSVDVDTATTPTVPVIVQYATDPSDAEVTSLGNVGAVSKQMHSIGAVAMKVPASQLTTLAQRSGIKYISLDRPLTARQAAMTATPIGTTPEFTLEPTNASWALSRGYNGQNIGVAVIDSGITPNLDLSTKATPLPALLASQPAVPYLGPNRIVFSYNFTSSNPSDTMDAFGHGTHVAGLIAGNGSSSTGAGYTRTFTGLAPNANLINLRVLDQNGMGTDSEVISAIEMAIKLKKTYNIKVINLSLGRPIFESYTVDPLCQTVEQAWKAGLVVVVAAGNDGRDLALNSEGYGTINAPGNDPYVITVGAANTSNTAALADDVMATYSSKGPSFIDDVAKPDIIAPGNLVTSILAPSSALQQENPTFFTPENWYVNNGPVTASTAYFPLSGTSMATAVASGAVADLMEIAGYLTPDQVKVLLMASANKNVIPATNVVTDPTSAIQYIAHNDVFTQGAGYLDLEATFNNTWNYAYAIPTGYALSPVATVGSTGGVTLVTDSTALWGRGTTTAATALTNAGSVYGQTAFGTTAATALWGRSTVAGASDPEGFTALWGATALWGRSTPDAEAAMWPASAVDGSTALWGRYTSLSF